MSEGTLTIYSASAGSGKTYRLTEIYLSHLFRSKFSYRNILAVTFTNKATAEMKSRILDHLHRLADGEASDYLPGLIRSTGRDEAWIRKEAGEILNSILHDYSRFSVSTIDSFFQKILRAFIREIGIHSGFNVELDHSLVLSSAVDAVIKDAGSDPKLRNWLRTYVLANIDEEKSWNIKESIIKLAEELFSEKYKILSLEEQSKLADKDFLGKYIERLRSLTSSFEKQLADSGNEAFRIYTEFNLSEDHFYRKGQGVPGYIRSLKAGIIKSPNSYVRGITSETPKWSTMAMSPELNRAIDAGLGKVLLNAIKYYDENLLTYNTAKCILDNIYALGILTDVSDNVRGITTLENTFLLSDAGEFLHLITGGDQTPFIYEKVGNRFDNFMIDEFQDTSVIQWENFKPLVINSMSEGYDNLVVGDVKQSIYRWRNSSWEILGIDLKKMTDGKRILSKPLTTNWRSRSNIIAFNNSLFTAIPLLVDNKLAGEQTDISISELYSEAEQADPGRRTGGYVRLEFIASEEDMDWQDKSLEKLPGIIEKLQDNSYKASDIGIIVRDSKEGTMVLNKLMEYSHDNAESGKDPYNFNVVSGDSLLMSNSPVIIFIISVLSRVKNPKDDLSLAVMIRYYLMAAGKEKADIIPLNSEDLNKTASEIFPDGFTKFFSGLNRMSLFEAIENIIRFFRLGEHSWNVPFLNTFQDHVINFSGNKNSDIGSFLEWWDESGQKKSVILPGNQDAIRILTIHKSKGLEFKAVILPFLSWGLDHKASKQPYLWVKPDAAVLNDLGILPVRYSSSLDNTIFAGDYRKEKQSIFLDNINLLYVALTRAMDVLYMFAPDKQGTDKSIAGVLREAFTPESSGSDKGKSLIKDHFDESSLTFEYGDIPQNAVKDEDIADLIPASYDVSRKMESLKLKLHGENYFSKESQEVRRKINYGRLMHEVFEGIKSIADIENAVKNLVLEGKLAASEATEMKEKILLYIRTSGVEEWFSPENRVLNEIDILLPEGVTRRPDRIIFRDGKTTVIDFKFGEVKASYTGQITQYMNLLGDMGYADIKGFIWYVDINRIISL